MKNKKIFLEVYNSNWVNIYREEAERLIKTIPLRFQVRIEHIGSTALLGCYSRHPVDILVGVKKEEDVLSLKDFLVTKKYTVWAPYSTFNHVVLLRRKNRRVTHEIHIVKYGSPEWNRYIAFRDLLNKNTKLIKEYTEFKVNLAKHNLETYSAYFIRREKFKDEILGIK